MTHDMQLIDLQIQIINLQKRHDELTNIVLVLGRIGFIFLIFWFIR